MSPRTHFDVARLSSVPWQRYSSSDCLSATLELSAVWLAWTLPQAADTHPAQCVGPVAASTAPGVACKYALKALAPALSRAI